LWTFFLIFLLWFLTFKELWIKQPNTTLSRKLPPTALLLLPLHPHPPIPPPIPPSFSSESGRFINGMWSFLLTSFLFEKD